MNIGLAIALSALLVFAAGNALANALPGHTLARTQDTINLVNRAICGGVAFVGLWVWIWSNVS